MSLRAAVMEVGSTDASQLFGQTKIFDILSDILTYQTEKLKVASNDTDEQTKTSDSSTNDDSNGNTDVNNSGNVTTTITVTDNDDDESNDATSDDSFRMYIWTFFCLLLKQVIESRDKNEFRSTKKCSKRSKIR